jgi:hypothetical protein
MDALDATKATAKLRGAHVALSIEDWIVWNWMNSEEGCWSMQYAMPYSMFHKCGVEQLHTVHRRDGTYKCSQCRRNPPTGIVVAYEFLSWEAHGYGG